MSEDFRIKMLDGKMNEMEAFVNENRTGYVGCIGHVFSDFANDK